MADCESYGSNSRELCIRFPGGASVCASPQGLVAPPPDELAQILMGQASSALAPLQPIFNLINALVSVKDFAEAVPALLYDPSELVEATQNLIENVTALANILPPLSVPVLVVDLITVLLRYLEGTVEKLEALIEQQAKIESARITAVENGLTELLANVDCAEQQVDELLENLQTGSGPIGSLIVTINSLGALAGLPEISFGDLSGDASETLDQISGLVATLTAIRDAIPI